MFGEITIPISVGKGYNIMVPMYLLQIKISLMTTAAIIYGFSNMTFTVYDFRGNVIYNEYKEEADINNIKGFSIDGWMVILPYLHIIFILQKDYF